MIRDPVRVCALWLYYDLQLNPPLRWKDLLPQFPEMLSADSSWLMSPECVNLSRRWVFFQRWMTFIHLKKMVQGTHYTEYPICGLYFMNRFGENTLVSSVHLIVCVLPFCLVSGGTSCQSVSWFVSILWSWG